MKISKILAGMSAAALAASMMTMGASAAVTNANFNNDKDYGYDVFAAVGAEKAATITSVRAKLSFKSIDDLKANGAGGGFITSSDGNNWKSTEFGNDGAGKPITFVVDEATATATMEKTLTDADNFKGEGDEPLSYAQVVFQSWWGDFAVDNVACYDADGELVCSVTGDGIDLYKAPEEDVSSADVSESDAPASSESTADPTDSTDSTESTDSTDSDESNDVHTDSVDSKTNSAATSSKAANNASNTNPSTGAAALAAVGVALAGAAVVATKKRK